jgi:8-hydroxy-5-deazaflavin:NADPH oxidoreductase
MKIAVIGAGNVGATLAGRWSALGHEVVLGAQDPASEKARATAASLGLTVSSLPEAAGQADVVLLATPGDVVIQAAQGCGDLTGKILVDATNPLNPQLSGLNHPEGLSSAQRLAMAIPGARVVKAFNTIGFGIMADPVLDGRRSVLFLSGDDREAVDQVSTLAREMGFEPVFLGGLSTSRMQEEHALLWIHLGVKAGLGRDFAFSLVRREAR